MVLPVRVTVNSPLSGPTREAFASLAATVTVGNVGGVVSLLPNVQAPRSQAPEAGRVAPSRSVVKVADRFRAALMAGEPALRCASNPAEVELAKSGALATVVPSV